MKNYQYAFTTIFTTFVLLLLMCVTGAAARTTDTLTMTKRFVIGSLNCGRNIPFNEQKLEAGLLFAANCTKNIAVLPVKTADSLSRLANMGINLSSMDLATSLHADGILFVRIVRLENILRAEILVANAPDYEKTVSGTGFALIRYRTEKSNERMYDPAILVSLQRAMCSAFGDSTLFEQQSGLLRITPATPLVVGGLEFINNEQILPPWMLFSNPTVQSFDAVVTMFDTAQASMDYVCFDVDTRDSIYALFKLYLIANDGKPSREELDALYKLEVRKYITGELRRTDAGAHIRLHLCDLIEGGTYSIIKTAEADVTEDTLLEFRRVLRSLTGTLLSTKQ